MEKRTRWWRECACFLDEVGYKTVGCLVWREDLIAGECVLDKTRDVRRRAERTNVFTRSLPKVPSCPEISRT